MSKAGDCGDDLRSVSGIRRAAFCRTSGRIRSRTLSARSGLDGDRTSPSSSDDDDALGGISVGEKTNSPSERE